MILGGRDGREQRPRRREQPLTAARDGETDGDGDVRLPAVREHGPRGGSPGMAVQSHARAAEEQRRPVVGVAWALRGRALVRLLLGAHAVRAVEPRLPPRLPGPALAKVLSL